MLIPKHTRLIELSKASGNTLIETLRDATEALRRQRFAQKVAAELSVLQGDSDNWNEYLAEAEQTNTSDGLG